MSEWFMVAVLKTAVRKHRGFESLSLRNLAILSATQHRLAARAYNASRIRRRRAAAGA
jgi:hypothetical protein